MGCVWLALIVASAIQPAAAVPGRGTTVAVSVNARSMQPGELVVLTIVPATPVSSLEVKAFGKKIPAFPTGDRHWAALVGIDVLQKPGPYTIAVEARGPTVS